MRGVLRDGEPVVLATGEQPLDDEELVTLKFVAFLGDGLSENPEDTEE